MLPSLPSLLPDAAPPSRPKDVRLKRASLTPVSPSPNPKVSLSGSSGSEIGLSRTASRNSAISSASSQNLSAQGMSRSVSHTSVTSASSLSVESAQRCDRGDGKGEEENRRSEPPTPSSLAAVLGNVMW